jgi:hypothetical protein
MGVPRRNVNDNTIVRVDAPYANSEGVTGNKDILGQKGFVDGLRIDLQKAQTHGGNDYATWQVQWGRGNNGKTGGAYAGALMQVDTDFTVAEFRQALSNSFDTLSYWRMQR